MIGLVFESLLGYVVVLTYLFREKRSQVQIMSFHGKAGMALKMSPWFSLQQVIPEEESSEQLEQKRNWKLELLLFSWVRSGLLTILIFELISPGCDDSYSIQRLLLDKGERRNKKINRTPRLHISVAIS